MSATSPKYWPAPSVARSSPCTVTTASPSPITKKPTPPPPSCVISVPAENVRSVNVRESVSRCFSSRPWKSGTRRRRSLGAAMAPILKHFGQAVRVRLHLLEIRVLELRPFAVAVDVEAAHHLAVAEQRHERDRLG